MTDKDGFLAAAMPFEERCAMAKKMLAELLSTLAKAVDQDIEYLQRMEQVHTERTTQLSSPAAIVALDSMHGQRKDELAKQNDAMLSLTWKSAIHISRLTWGTDAVDFALAAMKHETKNN